MFQHLPSSMRCRLFSPRNIQKYRMPRYKRMHLFVTAFIGQGIFYTNSYDSLLIIMLATQFSAGIIASQLSILILNIFKITYLNVVLSYSLPPPIDATNNFWRVVGLIFYRPNSVYLLPVSDTTVRKYKHSP